MSKSNLKAQCPIILRFHRLMDAFAKSDDERDFYLDKIEGYILFVNLDKSQEELDRLDEELNTQSSRYCLVPKMTYYEIKKFMEGFVNEKVYDIDTKEKLMDVIQSKEARENFLEFIYDHITELEKWQQYYHERFRIRIIEWLRSEGIKFVFEEDLELGKKAIEKVKETLFEEKVSKDVQASRAALEQKAKTYYSSEALNPRPKRGRPPKQTAKVELEPQVTMDMYSTVSMAARPFLYTPDISTTGTTFSAKFETEAELLASLRGSSRAKVDTKLEALSQRLESLRHLSSRLTQIDDVKGLKSEEKLFKAVAHAVEEEEEEDDKKIASFVHGMLPGRKRAKENDDEEPQPSKEASIKSVTPITKKTKK